MLIALNIVLAAVLVAGMVAFHLHAIHSEHKQRLQAAGPLHRGATAPRRPAGRRVGSSAAAA